MALRQKTHPRAASSPAPGHVHRVHPHPVISLCRSYLCGGVNNFPDSTMAGHQVQARYTHLCRGQRINPHKCRRGHLVPVERMPPCSDVIGKKTSPGAAHFAGHAPYSEDNFA